MGTDSLRRAIEGLETRLDPASGERTIDELARIRRDLADPVEREPVIQLKNLRLGFACKQRWEDMVGEDRVRACGGCDRPVFDLSAMTRAEAERLLATRGLTPCVRFYRRPDGTVMTSDCPSGERRERRRLAVVAGSLAAGAVLAAPSVASADAPTDEETTPEDPATPPPTADEPVRIDDTVRMGIPVSDYEVGIIIVEPRPRPAVEWSIWGRVARGFKTEHPTVLARSLTPPDAETSSTWEAALAADVTLGIANDGDIRLGAWAELRTSSGPVAGAELVVEGLPPHPLTSRIGGAGSIVLRAGGNAHVVTGALGFGYIGSWPRTDPWVRWARHVVGARFVVSVNRSRDDSRDWSATFGLEVEPIGVMHAVLDLVTGAW